jgi:hypothetical protein
MTMTSNAHRAFNRRAIVAIALTALIAVPTGFAPVASARVNAVEANAKRPVIKTITLIQAKPVLKTVTEPGEPPGTLVVFGAELRNTKGVKQGYLAGTLLTVDILGGAVADELRERSLNFELPAGTILARGISYYPLGDRELRPGKPVVIAVIGGTGAYIGASGEVTTTRLADGTYRQVITLVE